MKAIFTVAALAASFLLSGGASAAQRELVCTSLMSKKDAVESLAKRQQLLARSCSRAGGTGAANEFCTWAKEAQDDLDRCRAAQVPWASSVAIRYDADRPQDDAAEVRHYTCFTWPDPESVEGGIVTTTPAEITVVATKSKRLHDRYAQKYQPLVIDRRTMKAGHGTDVEFRCQPSGGRDAARRGR